jgi:hypothetical protein
MLRASNLLNSSYSTFLSYKLAMLIASNLLNSSYSTFLSYKLAMLRASNLLNTSKQFLFNVFKLRQNNTRYRNKWI